MPTPAQSAISLMVSFAEEHEGMRAHLDVWRELGVMQSSPRFAECRSW